MELSFYRAREIRKSDLGNIYQIERKVFGENYEARISPIGLIRLYERFPWTFSIIEDNANRVVGFWNAYFLTDLGSARMLDGKYHAAFDMGDEDLECGPQAVSSHLHIEMMVTIEKTDLRVSAFLIRDFLRSKFVKSIGKIRFISSIAGSPTGNTLLSRAGFRMKKRLRRLSDGTRPILYYLDLTTVEDQRLVRRFGLELSDC